MNGITNNLRILPSEPRSSTTPQQTASQVSFKDVLGDKVNQQDSLHFSKHAHMRLTARSIALSGEQLARIADGVNKAGEKGIRDSLVLVDDVALVVNVRSKTVITAMTQENENIFSNIDGAVIV